MSVLNRNKP